MVTFINKNFNKAKRVYLLYKMKGTMRLEVSISIEDLVYKLAKIEKGM